MSDAPIPPHLSFACLKQWDSMRVDSPQRRFCDQCQLYVHDLSAMSATEAGNFFAGVCGRVCVSFRIWPDGTMVTRRRWDALGKPWTILRRCVLALLAMAAPFWFAACTNDKMDCYRLGGSTIVGGDGKDSPPAATPMPINERLTGPTERP